MPWHKSMRDERQSGSRPTVLDVVMISSVPSRCCVRHLVLLLRRVEPARQPQSPSRARGALGLPVELGPDAQLAQDPVGVVQRVGASSTARASGAVASYATAGRSRTSSPPRRELERPPAAADLTGPFAPRKARTAWALASVGMRAIAASSRSAIGGVIPRTPAMPPAAATSARRAAAPSSVSSPSQPSAEHRAEHGASLLLHAHGRRQHHGVAQRAAEPRPRARERARRRPRRRTPRGRSSSRSAARAIPSASAAGPGPSRPRARSARRVSSAIRDSANSTPLARTRVPARASSTQCAISSPPSISCSVPRPRLGVDRRRSHATPPTTGSAPWRPRGLGRGERAHHVTAAADADHERASCRGE